MIAIFLLLWIVTIFYHSKKRNTVDWKKFDKSNTPLLMLYPMAFLIYEKIKPLLEKRDEKLNQQFCSLFLLEKEEGEEKVQLFRCRQFSMAIIVVIVCLAGMSILSMKQETSSLVIERNQTGQGAKEVTIELKGEKESQETYELIVEEQMYTRKQWGEQLERAKDYVEKTMIGENVSYDFVTKPLVFKKRIPESAIKISYTPKQHKWIDDVGNVQLQEVGEEGVVTEVTVCFQYKEQEAEVVYPIRLMPKEKTGEQIQYEAAIAQLKEEEQESVYESKFELPNEIENYTLNIPTESKNTGKWLIVLCLLGGGLWIMKEEEDIKEQERKRKQQLIKDYPEFIHQLVLLLGAGMTLKGAFIRMAETYEKRKERSQKYYHYLYEEIQRSVYEFQAGIAEEVVYRNFGMRMELAAYKRVVELLIQNLKKGTSDLVNMLGTEEGQALEMRKEQAKRLGEQAGTKLLMPMILLMAVVLLFTLYPAMVQFQV